MRKVLFALFVFGLSVSGVRAQSVHLSQYYNAPQLITPANTGLMPDDDYRLGMNYRNQWSALPVPYNTMSAWGDMKIGGNKDNERNNWLGLGFTMYTDKAGSGQLKLNQFQGNIAYHLQTSQSFMISLGLSAASIARSVDFNLLTFDAQWNGNLFNTSLPSNEKVGIVRTSYYTVGAGVNFSYFPNENVYVKLGGSVMNVNKPIESFYKDGTNQVALRPGGTLDVLARAGERLILNPSAYFTTQNGATEIVAGSLIRTILSGTERNQTAMQLILGGFYRVGDAVVGVVGLQVASVQFTATYDMTMSSLSPYNASYGALEFSLIYQGKYGKNKDGLKRSYNCPRFN